MFEQTDTYRISERPHTPTEHDIFEKVFLNSSLPNFNTL